MKTSCVILALLIFAACSNDPSSTTAVVLMHDETEAAHAAPVASEIAALYDFTVVENGGTFRDVPITDVSHTKATEAQIAPVNKWLSNSLARKKDVKAFKDSIAHILSRPGKDSSLPHSSVYLPIVQELTALAQSKADRRFLVVYSDLMENTPELSFYGKKTLKHLEREPEIIKTLFEQYAPVPKLSCITVYLIHEPTDAEHDRIYRIVSGFYKSLLEEHGATVHISANLTL
ncbi:MAG: hypothetical protein FD123_423 [Bacteroidetes bacterium]|nr:MAG: hypothetical protein FD123_423 [Bacteroidota bacterium]